MKHIINNIYSDTSDAAQVRDPGGHGALSVGARDAGGQERRLRGKQSKHYVYVYVYIYIYVYLYLSLYIYISLSLYIYISLSLYIYIYISIYLPIYTLHFEATFLVPIMRRASTFVQPSQGPPSLPLSLHEECNIT